MKLVCLTCGFEMPVARFDAAQKPVVEGIDTEAMRRQCVHLRSLVVSPSDFECREPRRLES